MYEKSFNARKSTGQSNKDTVYSVQNGAGGKKEAKATYKKDSGYTLTTTPVFQWPQDG